MLNNHQKSSKSIMDDSHNYVNNGHRVLIFSTNTIPTRNSKKFILIFGLSVTIVCRYVINSVFGNVK